jgi:hypothetical protein
VAVNGGLVTIAPSSLLEKNKYYYILIDSGAFNNEEGNPYMGLSDIGFWTFATLGNNIALNKPSSASGIVGETFGASNGNDENINNIWSSGAPPAGTKSWWQVDLIDQYKIDYIELVARQNADQEFVRRDFRILGSNSSDFSSSVELAMQGSTPFKHQGTWQANITNNSGFRFLRLERTDSRAMNFAEFRAFGELVSITLAKEISDMQTSLKVYPNPVNNILYVESDSKIDFITITDMNGTLIKQIICRNKKEKILLDSIPSGVYLINAYHKSGIESRKISKN